MRSAGAQGRLGGAERADGDGAQRRLAVNEGHDAGWRLFVTADVTQHVDAPLQHHTADGRGVRNREPGACLAFGKAENSQKAHADARCEA